MGGIKHMSRQNPDITPLPTIFSVENVLFDKIARKQHDFGNSVKRIDLSGILLNTCVCKKPVLFKTNTCGKKLHKIEYIGVNIQNRDVAMLHFSYSAAVMMMVLVFLIGVFAARSFL